MANKLSGWDDTIVALATPPGIGAIGVIRLSGADAFTIVDKLLPGKEISNLKSHTIHLRVLKHNGEAIDEVVISIFAGPKSYTGENVIEISCHGSPFIQQQIIEACIAEGARLAKPGEYTQRAFLKGKLDLTQAEAVADLIASNTHASQKTALNNVRGGFTSDLSYLRDRLITFASLIELELDFATEDVDFADRKQFYELLENIQSKVEQLVNSFKFGNVIKNGVSVAIIGKPNAGKSTLLNALLNDERAIVSDIAGTTRDTIEEQLNINGIIFRLIDTAGIRSHSADIIEQQGMARSIEKMKTADLVIYVFDVNTKTIADLKSQVELLQTYQNNYILIGNKSDSGNDLNNYSEENILFISAKSKTGIEELKSAIYNVALHDKNMSEGNIITNARHYQSLQQILSSINSIKDGLDNNIPGDLLSTDINHALYYLGEITGEITNEDKLDYIFSKFCIGK
ncbi:MAG: tRNA uridine-5-carboxymethylaminomethyl(34) synthesis GTPase MnmE [Ferruginibacter sp.]